MKSLTDNAGQIAVFLSGANPNLPRDPVRGLFLAHDSHQKLCHQWLFREWRCGMEISTTITPPRLEPLQTSWQTAAIDPLAEAASARAIGRRDMPPPMNRASGTEFSMKYVRNLGPTAQSTIGFAVRPQPV